MAKPDSNDLRERVVKARRRDEPCGRRRFGVAVSSTIHGTIPGDRRCHAGQDGGGKIIVEPHRDFMIAVIGPTPDRTMRGLPMRGLPSMVVRAGRWRLA